MTAIEITIWIIWGLSLLSYLFVSLEILAIDGKVVAGCISLVIGGFIYALILQAILPTENLPLKIAGCFGLALLLASNVIYIRRKTRKRKERKESRHT